MILDLSHSEEEKREEIYTISRDQNDGLDGVFVFHPRTDDPSDDPLETHP